MITLECEAMIVRSCRIWHTNSSFDFGGIEIRMIREAAKLIELGYQLSFVCNSGSLLAHHAKKAGLDVIPFRMRQCYQLSSMIRFYHLLKNARVNLLHCHTSKDHWVCAPAARLLGIPIVRTRHVSAPVRTNYCSSFIYTNLSDRILLEADSIKNNLLRIPGLPADRLVSIPNGIDLTVFLPAQRGERITQVFGLEGAYPIIGCIARLDEDKGHSYLLEAVSSIVKAWPNARLLLVGDGPPDLKAKLTTTTAALQLGSHVIFTGFRTDIPQLLAVMTCVVLPTCLPEGCPTAILEAQAMGKPVIATRIGGVPEIIQDRVTGLLVEPENSSALASAILWLLDHLQEAQDMAGKARDRVAKEFSLESAVSGTTRVYEELL